MEIKNIRNLSRFYHLQRQKPDEQSRDSETSHTPPSGSSVTVASKYNVLVGYIVMTMKDIVPSASMKWFG
jgi:hypothetical protein